MAEETMTTLPSPTPTTNNSTQQEQIHNNNPPSNSTNNDSNTNVVQILSSHPRFSTSEIIQKFPNIQHRFCHKIKVSIPWRDDSSSPNYDTYYKAIYYFFDIVKTSDPQFQILTWNIHDKECNSISDKEHIPHSHNELSTYLYNLHISPSRIRTSMVITSSFNLGQLFRNQARASDDQLNLLKMFRQEKLWVQPSTIQTMGEIKLIGFLQFVHPHCTNLKKLLISLQAIVETRDIVVELYRPRAVNKENKIITAPEAIAIGAPSDISVDIYKSFIDKWTGVIKGHYDILIGKNSPLKDGYFIPFANGILSQEDKNDAITRHANFIKTYTGFQLKRCSSVNVRFDLPPEETDKLGYNIKKDKKKRTTTLRRILESWPDETSDNRLIQSIDPCNAHSHTLLIKASNKRTVTKKITDLLEVLKIRNDFANICGNKDNYGASVDRFSFSKSGNSYLTQLKKLRKTQSHGNDSDNSASTIESKKRDRLQIKTNSNSGAKSPSSSPLYKKGTNSSSEQETDVSKLSTPTNSNITSDKQKPYNPYKSASHNSSLPKSKPTFQQIVCQSLRSPPTIPPTLIVAPNRTKLASKPQSKISDREISVHPPVNECSIIPAPPNKVITYDNSPPSTLTLSTIVPDMVSKSHFDTDNNMLTRLSDKQILDITQNVSERYDLVIQKMQDTYNSQIRKIETEIETIKTSQGKLKCKLEKRLDSKINEQTKILHSIVSMVQNIQPTSTSQKVYEQPNRYYYQL